MSQEERFGTRDRTYSAWHRRLSTQRFVGIELAQTLAMIDLDAALYVEYDDATREPVALIETAADVGQRWKASIVTRNLARRCVPVVPAYVVLYRISSTRNPADANSYDISAFRIRRIHPNEEQTFTTCTPAKWAECLVKLRRFGARSVDLLLSDEERAAS